MKKYLISIVLILLFSLLFASSTLAADKIIITKNQKIYKKGFGYDLNFYSSYPKLSGLDNTKKQKELNKDFKIQANYAVKKAKDTAKELAKHPETRKIKVTGIYDFKVKRNKGGIVSILLSDYLYSGGSRGITVTSGVTINTNSGEVYKLKDLFKDNVDFVAVLSNIISKQIEVRGLSDNLLTEFRSISKEQTFYLTERLLVIVFNEYEYFPYSFGVMEFRIPLKMLDELLIDGIIVK